MNTIFQYTPVILQGIGETLILAFVSLSLGLFFGMVFSILESSNQATTRISASLLSSLLRGLPEILILFAIYFGSSYLLSTLNQNTLEINTFFASALALSLVFAANASKIFQAAHSAIRAGEKEIACNMGFSRSQILYHILIPQTIRKALPGLGNLWFVLIKDTALVSLIGGADLISRIQIVIRNTHQPFTFYFLLAGIYLLLTTFSEWGMKRITHHA